MTPSPTDTATTTRGGATGHRVVIVDDHELLGRGLADQLRVAGHDAELLPVQDRTRVLEQLGATAPDLVILDLGLPIPGGGQGLVGPLAAAGLRIVVLTGSEDRLRWAGCMDEGAAAVLAKSEPLTDILDAIATLLSGLPVRSRQRLELAQLLARHRAESAERISGFEALSRRERAVLTGLVAGRGTQEIADRDSVSVATVRSQVKSMLAKLGVHSQLAAVARANEVGWHQAPEREVLAGQA